MSYCIRLAKRAGKATRTNPQVGSVLVYQDQVIAEGFHEKYGEGHAERNAINQAIKQHPKLIAQSTLYVTLEPCFHQGKTPPCVQFVLENKIRKVVVGTLDPNPLVAGQSIQLLKDKGVEVVIGILDEDCKHLIRKFVTNLSKRPYIILKMAQSYDGYMGQKDKQVWISNKYSKVLVHKWRSEVDGIMVGTQTAITDDPQLTTREWPGEDPIRIIPDFNHRIPLNSKVTTDGKATIILKEEDKSLESPNIKTILAEAYNVESYWNALYEAGVYSILVEGGQKLIKSILETNLWDEARIIQSSKKIGTGIKAPMIQGRLYQKQRLSDDLVLTILNDLG